ncbi:conserved hypothetical protein [Paenibacillus curdlanolyticus YK9]|uniref:Lipoprotein n=1 Tax=Paenibacillus curdlanolyticus YK9 TaxID=717606 RepID=E0I7P3_9BACL|nr:hypothetical protein [Paenibacillus curdlanolyticus]EFM11198.1 conserved hypothetical protein [Paenibacillus curdlanolyticus YK9]
MKRSKASRIAVWLLSVIWLAALAGCGSDASSEKQGTEQLGTSTIAETKQDDFIYRLIIEPADAASKRDVKLYGELEYVGDKDEIDIHHAASPFFFFLKETTRGYDIGYMMNEPAITTKLKKGVPLREQYKGGGGYSEKDDTDYVAFIKDLWKNGFPVGHYEVTGWADFFTGQEASKQDYHITAKRAFDIKEAAKAVSTP